MSVSESEARKKLHSVSFEIGHLNGKLKEAKRDCIAEETDKCAEDILKLQAEGKIDKFSLRIYLNDLVSKIRDIENR